jgi:hypothetical protein
MSHSATYSPKYVRAFLASKLLGGPRLIETPRGQMYSGCDSHELVFYGLYPAYVYHEPHNAQ